MFRVTLGDGPTLALPLERNGQAWLERLHDRECGLERVNDVASVDLSEGFRRVQVGEEPFLRGDLVLQRSADAATSRPTDERMVVESLAGSVLLELLPAPDSPGLPATLPPQDDVLRVPVLIGSSHRCDGHALGGSSQTFLLSAYVRVPDLPTQRVIVIPDKQTRVRALAVVSAACG